MATKPTKPKRGALPARYLNFQKSYPKVFRAYAALGAATQEAGPLPKKTRALAKRGAPPAAGDRAGQALEAGCTPGEIRHVVLLATTTIGFPAMMSTMSWVDDVLATKG